MREGERDVVNGVVGVNSSYCNTSSWITIHVT